MGKKSAVIFRLGEVSRETFTHALARHPLREDRFGWTFLAKADMLLLWPVLGAFTGSNLAAAIAWTVNQRQPMANLQLLHTFSSYRRRGAATLLANEFLRRVREAGATHFRVSSERTAVFFYESLGIVFLGRQKSGCELAVGRIGPTFAESVYDPADPLIHAALYRSGKGGCVEVYAK